ncbi:MAG: hypothetical protein SFY80_15990 [Verrucomicrobiota bacterium]|nr:hypothetical protein [Verrucomicrobiota bacterium]
MNTILHRTLWLLLFIIPSLSLAEDINEKEQDVYYSLEDWNLFVEKISNCDEIRMVLVSQKISIAKRKRGRLSFSKGYVYNVPVYKSKRIRGPKELSQILEFKPKTFYSDHFCMGLFNLLFYRNGEFVAGLNYAHGKFYVPITKSAQDNIIEWLKAQGFPIQKILKNEQD